MRVRNSAEYFDDVQDVKIMKDMLELAKHIVDQKSGHFDPSKFEDHYEAALQDLLNKKQSGEPITRVETRSTGNVVDLMDALRASLKGGADRDTVPKVIEERPEGKTGGEAEGRLSENDVLAITEPPAPRSAVGTASAQVAGVPKGGWAGQEDVGSSVQQAAGDDDFEIVCGRETRCYITQPLIGEVEFRLTFVTACVITDFGVCRVRLI